MPYDWGGTRILQKQTSLVSARRVLGHEDTPVRTDLREWVVPGDREEIDRVIRSMDLPARRKSGTFDERARLVWEWVIREIRYVGDEESTLGSEFWQFPQETLALRKGDCEDAAVLLVSLLLAAGISPFCTRVVIGWLSMGSSRTAHAWPVYKDETGVWRILEATINDTEMPALWPAADLVAKRTSLLHYTPDLCFNNVHVWQVRNMEIRDVAEYIGRLRRRRSRFASRASQVKSARPDTREFPTALIHPS